MAAAAEEATTTERIPSSEHRVELITRIRAALGVAAKIFADADGRYTSHRNKAGGDPVTEIDLALDAALKEALLRPGEGWLSEETIDDPSRLDHRLVWVVDPLDGTREFMKQLPEYCTSVAAVVDGTAVAGGVLNPAAELEIVGGQDEGVYCNGRSVVARDMPTSSLHRVLASRSEFERGEWRSVADAGLDVVPMGSVAYKIARVAAGLDPLTWTPEPKHEWDVAAGAALMAAAGGLFLDLDGRDVTFNRPHPWLNGAIAIPQHLRDRQHEIRELIVAQTEQR